MPCLSGAEPLELLLEIGLEKLYKDYEFIYTESKLCSTNLLKEDSSEAANDDGSPQNLPQLRKSLHNAVRGDPMPGAGMRKTLLLFKHCRFFVLPSELKYVFREFGECLRGADAPMWRVLHDHLRSATHLPSEHGGTRRGGQEDRAGLQGGSQWVSGQDPGRVHDHAHEGVSKN